MNKLVVVPKNKDIECFIDRGIDKFIFGLKDYAVNYYNLTMEEIFELSKHSIIFLAINKNLENKDLIYIEEVLIKLNNTNIKVLFYDLAILQIKKRLKLNIELVWNQTHMVTNYNTCNYYYDEGVKYAYLANEITLEEMCTIREKSKLEPLVFVFGYSAMSFSKRKLLTNYFKSINLDKNKDEYIIKNKGNYLIKEDKLGTVILNYDILVGIKPMVYLNKNNFNYFILSEDVNRDLFLQVIDKYEYVLNHEVEDSYYNELYELVGSHNLGFFYNKTIFRVKENDK